MLRTVEKLKGGKSRRKQSHLGRSAIGIGPGKAQFCKDYCLRGCGSTLMRGQEQPRSTGP